MRGTGSEGEPERGLRRVDPAEAAVVVRIYRAYAGGLSPRAIARQLNAESISGPGGGIWYDATIRGRLTRGEGILRNPLYDGRLVWNRVSQVKEPRSGARRRRPNPPSAVVEKEISELRIVPPELWEQVQRRLSAEAAPKLADRKMDGPAKVVPAFWERQRPRHLLSHKVVCGVCGRPTVVTGQDYLACPGARQGVCRNHATIRRGRLESHVLELLGRRLMPPEIVAEVLAAFRAEWGQLQAEIAQRPTSPPAS